MSKSSRLVSVYVAELLERRALLAAGDPDFAFSGDGRASLSFPGAAMVIVDTAVTLDGKVIVGGYRTANMAVARLNQDGTLDTTFGNGGLYESSVREKVTSLAVQGDGKIILGLGYASGFFHHDLAVGRLLASGLGFDPSFGTNGIADAGYERFDSSEISDVAIQRDGKIVGAGNIEDSLFVDHDFAVVRYTANGVLDSTFNGDGVVVEGFGTDVDEIAAVTIDYNGNSATNPLYGTIVAVGGGDELSIEGTFDPDRFQILRLRPDGNPDTTFDGDGKYTSPNLSGLGVEYAHGVVVQPGGKIVVAGTSISGLDANLRHFLVARYTSAGALDTTFGPSNTGVNELDLGGRDEVGAIAVGYLGTANNVSAVANVIISGSRDGSFAAVALRGDGRLDTAFSGDGILTTSIPGHASGLVATGDLIAPVRRFVMAGGGQVARYVDVGSVISVGTFQPYMYEQGAAGTSFIVAIDRPLPYDLTVFLTTSGTATPRGTLRDFNAQNIVFGDGQTTSTNVVIPAGANFVNVILTPIDDTRSEGDENITFTVGATSQYDAGIPGSTTLAITDNDVTGGPTVNASAFHFQTAPQALNFTFSQDVSTSVVAGDLQVRKLPSGSAFAPAGMTYAPITRTATFTFNTPLGDGNYRATLPAGSVIANGVPLAADYTFDFHVLAGDANRDKQVDFADMVILAQNYNQSGRTFGQGNYDYSVDGLVGFNDLVILAQRYGTNIGAVTAALETAPEKTRASVGKRRSIAAEVV